MNAGQPMSTSISPLAPASFPDMPPVDGVRLATAAAGIRYPGRTDVLLALFDAGTTVSGVFTRSKCPSAAVDWCRERIGKGARQRARGQFRQRQRLHRQIRPRRDQAHRRDRRQSRRLQAGRRVSRLDRRDRRAARCDEVRRRHGSSRRRRQARRLARRRQGDHDHRHVSEGRSRRSSAWAGPP